MDTIDPRWLQLPQHALANDHEQLLLAQEPRSEQSEYDSTQSCSTSYTENTTAESQTADQVILSASTVTTIDDEPSNSEARDIASPMAGHHGSADNINASDPLYTQNLDLLPEMQEHYYGIGGLFSAFERGDPPTALGFTDVGLNFDHASDGLPFEHPPAFGCDPSSNKTPLISRAASFPFFVSGWEQLDCPATLGGQSSQHAFVEGVTVPERPVLVECPPDACGATTRLPAFNVTTAHPQSRSVGASYRSAFDASTSSPQGLGSLPTEAIEAVSRDNTTLKAGHYTNIQSSYELNRPTESLFGFLRPCEGSVAIADDDDNDTTASAAENQIIQAAASRHYSAPELQRPLEIAPRQKSTTSNARVVIPNLRTQPNNQQHIRSASFSHTPLSQRHVEIQIINWFNPTTTKTDLVTTTKGRRTRPLDDDIREGAKKVRQERSICIRCKKDRQNCNGVREDGSPCSRCVESGSSAKWPQPCTKAHFLDIIRSGTCNYISQRAVNHITVDGSRRIRIDLPETFDLENVLDLISKKQGDFNIRVRHGNDSVYVLQLDKCFQYLNKHHRRIQKSQHDLRAFVDISILEATNWTPCVSECNPAQDIMALMYVWNNMPSRATYSYVPKPKRHLHHGNRCPDQIMDVEDAEDAENIILAAHLSRIVCRKLEVDAYTKLQKTLNHIADLKPEEAVKFVRELGLILLTLRWRVSWWTVLGDGGKTVDRGKRQFEERVNALCRVLYFYYCSIRRKIPTWNVDKEELIGVWSSYADTSSAIFDEFPEIESIEGFERWMERGRELIAMADVRGKLAGIGLRAT